MDEKYDQQNRRLRKIHPDWPSHKPTITIPHQGTFIIYETMPIGKAKGVKGHCKYCYTTHRNWWVMDSREDLEDSRLLLCGNCEHTSLETHVKEIGPYG